MHRSTSIPTPCVTAPRFPAPVGSLAEAAKPSRRALIGGAGLFAIAAAVPTLAVSASSGESAEFSATLDASQAATRRFNALPDILERADPVAYDRELQAMSAATRAADRATPTNWAEFVRLFDHQCDGGESALDDANAESLLAHANCLLSTEGR